MSKAINFLEKVSYTDVNEFNESIETVSITDAITACKIQELETLQKVNEDQSCITKRILELNTQLRNLKLK